MRLTPGRGPQTMSLWIAVTLLLALQDVLSLALLPSSAASSSASAYSSGARRHRSKRTIIGRYPLCPRGCTSCSEVNVCVTCESRYYMFLYRQNMRQIGICTPSCPLGYYGVRYQHYNKCNRCLVEHCHACFNRHYCTHCAPPYLAFEGKCIESCPNNMYYANYSKVCQESVDCMVGPWSSWSHCSRNGFTCGYKYGKQTRSRQVLDFPSPNGRPCPELTARRRCRLARRWCYGQCKRKKRRGKRRKRKNRRGRKRRKDRSRGRHHRKRPYRQPATRRRHPCRERRCNKTKRKLRCASSPRPRG